ncbi:MAG: Rdx family protein [Nitrospinae bacterium]|nr:Rdx family protein [Nitrospinota bacterium]
MAAKIEQRFGVSVELIGGGGGIFDVMVDGDLLFSKHAAGRFPEEREILDRLAART